MTDLIDRLRRDVAWHEHRGNETIAKDIREAVGRISALESRLEISLRHSIDGIDARDATIRLLESVIRERDAECASLRDTAHTAFNLLCELDRLAGHYDDITEFRERSAPFMDAFRAETKS